MRESDLLSWSQRIAEQAAQLDAATHGLLTDLREFDLAGGPGSAGLKTAAQWLSWRVGWDLVTAREHMRVAHALGGLPKLDDAIRRGRISYSKLRALTRVATPANEEELLTYAESTTAAQLEKICRKLAAVEKLVDKDSPEARRRTRFLRRRELDDGSVSYHLVLPPDEAGMFDAVLESEVKRLANLSAATPATDDGAVTEREQMWLANASAEAPGNPDEGAEESPHREPTAAINGPNPRPKHGLVDALTSLVEQVMRGSHPERTPVELVVTVPIAALAEPPEDLDVPRPDPIATTGSTADGLPIPAAVALRLACDCGFVSLVTNDHGNPLSIGHKTRVISAPMRRALLARDRTCQYPGCTNRAYLHAHHIRHWAHGGKTEIDNLCSVCSYHHPFVHELGYSVRMLADGGFEFRDPRGRVIPPVSERIEASAELAMSVIRTRNATLPIDGNTAAHGWNGQPIDYALAVNSVARRFPVGPQRTRSEPDEYVPPMAYIFEDEEMFLREYAVSHPDDNSPIDEILARPEVRAAVEAPTPRVWRRF
jgi:hypothetical protein